MHTISFRAAGIALLILTLTITLGAAVMRDDDNSDLSRPQLWKKVQEARNNGLPKTEMELLQTIYNSAVAEGVTAEAIRALCQKIASESQINQPAQPFAIRKLGEMADEIPADLKPVTNAILANWYYSYFQQNRWRFQRRSQTSEVPGEDFESWNLEQILNEIDRRYQTALENPEALKNAPVGDYEMLLQKGTLSDSLRPTMYDFIANEAINFYSLDEQIIRQKDAFELQADGGAFAEAADFLQYQPATGNDAGEDDAMLLKAVRLYQDLLRFHANDDDRSAWLDANLNRIAFANNHSTGESAVKQSLYRAALQRFAGSHSKHLLSSKALAMLATSHHAEGEFEEAHRIADQGLARFPDSPGGAMCFNLIARIETPSMSINTETIWNRVSPEFQVRHRNLKQVWFRVVPFDFESFEFQRRGQPESMDAKTRRRLLSLKPVLQWDTELDAGQPFAEGVTDIEVPGDLAKGSWMLLASSSERFEDGNHFLFAHHLWQTELSHIDRASNTSPLLEGQVVDSITGDPVAEATVSVQSVIHSGRKPTLSKPITATTDADGIYTLQLPKNTWQHRFLIRHGDETFGFLGNNSSNHAKRSPDIDQEVRFFTDRSIYRPGQTVHFKGICIHSDRDGNEYRTLPTMSINVELRDVNNQVVETQRFKSNDLGSFSGSFTAPADRATGMMQLFARGGGINGQTSIRVEEYKRPKFKVDIEAPKKSFALNETVSLTGSALAYTGAAIDGATVKYRVVRSVNYPGWWYARCWWHPINTETQEITNGSIETDTNGKFTIEFPAKPDPKADRKGEPVFRYQVYADVTDTAGETRSSERSISVGYTSVRAGLSHEDWLTANEPLSLKLTTQTLDGVNVAGKGTLTIHSLKGPQQPQRTRLLGNARRYGVANEEVPPIPDLSKIDQWPLGPVTIERSVATNEKGISEQEVELPEGVFRAVFETTAPNGAKATAESTFLVINPGADAFGIQLPDHFAVKDNSVQPGDAVEAIWSTGYEQGRAFVEIVHRQKVVKSWWTDPGTTSTKISIPVKEAYRGGFQLNVSHVKENRLYSHTQQISVPWDNKKLQVKWEHFTSNLQPGGRETWTAVVSGDDAELSAMEMVASMYDSSLDQFSAHSWNPQLGSFYGDWFYRNMNFSNGMEGANKLRTPRRTPNRAVSNRYRQLAQEIMANRFGGMHMMGMGGYGRGAAGGAPMMKGRAMSRMAEPMAAMAADGMAMGEGMAFEADSSEMMTGDVAGDGEASGGENGGADGGSGPDLSDVPIRKNLQETAFFYPALTVDADGRVKIEFEVPEALTTWKFMGLAHDAQLRTAMLTDEMTTSKDLMVQPNPPRFLREGDEIYFSVKVINQSDKVQTGTVQLQLSDAFDQSSIDEAFSNVDNQQTFEIPARESQSVFWNVKVPDFTGAIAWKAVAATDSLSDGEENWLPVLSKRILVRESLPLPVRGNETKTFTFDALEKMQTSDSLRSQSMTVQMTSNPSWYAVMALPYLMEYPHQCSEQTFNRMYANALGQKIVSSNDRIETIFQQWRGTDALKSPLEKNEDLRNVMIAETPWLIDGKNESQARRDVGNLFDRNRMSNEIRSAQQRIAQMQLADGTWPWFPGGRANDYLTLYITTGYGRLRKLGVDVDMQPAFRSLTSVDTWLKEKHDWLIKHDHLDRDNLSSRIALYLYGRTFFLEDQSVSDQNRAAFDYFVGQAKTYWMDLSSRQSQAHLAIAMKRLKKDDTANAIMKSLTERSLTSDEMGQFWRESEDTWYWHEAPIETQAMMIEAYDEVLGDRDRVEECKIWLLKQKQTQAWSTTKSTADAVYALLLRGTDNLASSKLVQVSVGGKKVKPDAVEAGTGFYEVRYDGSDITPAMKTIEVAKSDDDVAWGSVHWQYLEDVGKIEPYEGTPLTVKKSLYVKKNSDSGPVISPVTGALAVGDELVTRVEVRVDRDMEYVHLKDYRGSGTEPVNVLSRYKSQDGLWYYESTKDTASHFFIDWMPRGNYVLEYSTRIQLRGTYQTGIAELQCMYAPEFNSHSGSVKITVE